MLRQGDCASTFNSSGSCKTLFLPTTIRKYTSASVPSWIASNALYRVLARLYVLGINVTKLESRPIPDRDFEFMFYFDLDTSIYSEEFVQLMCELDDLCEEFKYLGSYSEVV